MGDKKKKNSFASLNKKVRLRCWKWLLSLRETSWTLFAAFWGQGPLTAPLSLTSTKNPPKNQNITQARLSADLLSSEAFSLSSSQKTQQLIVLCTRQNCRDHRLLVGAGRQTIQLKSSAEINLKVELSNIVLIYRIYSRVWILQRLFNDDVL